MGMAARIPNHRGPFLFANHNAALAVRRYCQTPLPARIAAPQHRIGAGIRRLAARERRLGASSHDVGIMKTHLANFPYGADRDGRRIRRQCARQCHFALRQLKSDLGNRAIGNAHRRPRPAVQRRVNNFAQFRLSDNQLVPPVRAALQRPQFGAGKQHS